MRLVPTVTAAVSKSRIVKGMNNSQMLFNKMFRFIFSISFSLASEENGGKKWQRMRIKWFLSLLLISICRCSFSHLYFAINNNGHRLTKLLEIIEYVVYCYRFRQNIVLVWSFENSTGQPSSLPSYLMLAIRKSKQKIMTRMAYKRAPFFSLFLSQRPQIIENVHAARVFGWTNKCLCRH